MDECPPEHRTLTTKDILSTVKTLVELKNGRGIVDDIDHLGNRRLRTIDEMTHDRIRNTGRWPQYDRVMQISKVVDEFTEAETISINTGSQNDMRLRGKPIEAGKTYKVAGWAPVAEEARYAGNPMVWDLVEQWLKAQGGKVGARKLNAPKVTGVVPNPGYAA